MLWLPPSSTLFPYTTLFRSGWCCSRNSPCFTTAFSSSDWRADGLGREKSSRPFTMRVQRCTSRSMMRSRSAADDRSEEHTSELQSPCNLVCRLLLEKKKKEL